MVPRPDVEVLRRIPRTDDLLRDPALAAAADARGAAAVKNAIRAAQEAARHGEVAPEDVAAHALSLLPAGSSSLHPVLNATGVVVHTNIGRAPLSVAARDALLDAAGYTDVEMDLATGQRSRRGAGATDALLASVPGAEDALVVNNGAAALLLAVTALAATPVGTRREVVVSRGELVEIGAGFRLPDLMQSAGARLREVGTTNRTHSSDYADAISPETAAIVKIHPSNFRVEGFTSEVDITALARIAHDAGLPLVVDIGSGLLAHDDDLPDEPDAASTLAAGADLVTSSGDKLLGGPQAGIVLGRADLVERLRRHPMARAVRVDKTTLAALEATLRRPVPPVTRYRLLTRDDVRGRTVALAEVVGGEVVEVVGRIGGGGAPGHELPGLAVALPGAHPDALAARLRAGHPAVLARVDQGRVLVDLRCVEPSDDEALRDAVLAARVAPGGPAPDGPAPVGTAPGPAPAPVPIPSPADEVDEDDPLDDGRPLGATPLSNALASTLAMLQRRTPVPTQPTAEPTEVPATMDRESQGEGAKPLSDHEETATHDQTGTGDARPDDSRSTAAASGESGPEPAAHADQEHR